MHNRVSLPLVSCLSAALLLCACGDGTSDSASSLATAPRAAKDVGKPLAVVGGLPIGSKEFDTLARRQMGADGELTDAMRGEVIERLVKEKLLYIAALEKGIDRDPKIQKMMINTLLKKDVYGELRSGDIGEDELRAYFEGHQDEFVVPEKVQIKRILLKAETDEADEAFEARAKALHESVSAHPEDFRALAQKHSQGPFARRGGELGFMTSDGKPGVEPEVVKAGFATPKGSVSAPFKTTAGWNIVYVPNRHDKVVRTFEQMRGSVIRKVKQSRYKDLYDSYVEGLRGRTEVVVYESELAAHAVPVSPGSEYGGRSPLEGPGTGSADQPVVPSGADAIPVAPPELPR